MRTLVFVVPGDLASLTGGYGYDRRIIAGLEATGWTVDIVSLGAGFPFPDAGTREHAAQRLGAIPDGSLVVVDGLAFGAMPELVDRHARRLRWVALVHHPLALETGLSAEQRRTLLDSERRALASARGVIVTSSTIARELARLGVPSASLRVVPPGTDPAPLATGSGADEATLGLSLLCVATLIPRKGHAVLLEALRGLQDRRWTLHCVGGARDADTAKALRAAIDAHGLRARVHLHGEVLPSSLQAMYDRADAVVLPSFFEGYGMVLAEALARGLPVVSTTAGAIAETVPSGAGILVPPGDALALRAALADLLDDRDRRARLAAGARAVRSTLPTWPQAVSRFAAALIAFDEEHEPGGAMTGFSVDWLRLREPFDHAARKAAWDEAGVAGVLARWRRQRPGTSFAAIDLACGLGANLRELAPRLGGVQHWRLVDHDPVLLAALPHSLEEWAHRHGYCIARADGSDGTTPVEIIGGGFHAQVVLQRLDLARDLANLDFRQTHLVTASALLDLVSAPWLRTLLRKAQANRCAMWFALNVDGRTTWDPPDPDDERVHRLFSRHQRRDKGFGDALGPQAAAFVVQEIAGSGYESLQVPTDWVIEGAQAPDMQRAMIEGMATAALEQDPGSEGVVRSWRARRSAAVGGSRLRVGHVDILATPL